MERNKIPLDTKKEILSKLSILLDSEFDWKFDASRQGNSLIWKPQDCFNKMLTKDCSSVMIDKTE